MNVCLVAIELIFERISNSINSIFCLQAQFTSAFEVIILRCICADRLGLFVLINLLNDTSWFKTWIQDFSARIKKAVESLKETVTHASIYTSCKICINNVLNYPCVCVCLVSKPAPHWEGTAVINGEFKELKLSDYRGKYLVFFFYPLDLCACFYYIYVDYLSTGNH